MNLAIVVPCFNEAPVLEELSRRLLSLVEEMLSTGLIEQAEILFVDDGSSDPTWSVIEELAAYHPNIHGLKLSRNVGHQHALLAGLLTCEGDAAVSVDADLQDDVETIKEMVIAHAEGAEVVYGVRKQRASDTLFKRKTAELYYRFLRAIGVDVVYNHADFRLLGRRALEGLREFREVNLFLRGIVPLIGFSSQTVFYDRAPRFAGHSKYPLRRMIAFAVDGITSFSVAPLRVIMLIGVLVFLATVIMSMWVLGIWLFTDKAVPGWASTTLPMYFLGGIQILSIGVIGEYLGKVYSEVKARPRYIIEKKI